MKTALYVVFGSWCFVLVVGLLFSWGLWNNRAEANGSGVFGKLGLWTFGVLLALSVALVVIF